MKFFIPLILSFLPLLSCNTPNEKRLVLHEDFPIHTTLQSTTLDINFPTGCTEELFFFNNRLVLIDNHCNDYILQMIDLKSGETKRILRKGRGPTEYLSLNSAGHRKDDSLLFRTGSSFYWLNPDELWENKPELTEIISPIKEPFIDCFQLSNQWAYTSLTGDYSIVFVDEKGDFLQSTPFYPPVGLAETHKNYAYWYYSSTSYSDAQNLIVNALRYFPLIIISDLNGKIVKVIQTSDEFNLPEFDSHGISPQPNTLFYYDKVLLSDDRIYAFRLNAKASDLENLNFIPTLEVYDYNGNPLIKISFSEAFGGVDIDHANGIIYGAAFCKETFEVIPVKIEIPAELLK